jgi:hypothetical protein
MKPLEPSAGPKGLLPFLVWERQGWEHQSPTMGRYSGRQTKGVPRGPRFDWSNRITLKDLHHYKTAVSVWPEPCN